MRSWSEFRYEPLAEMYDVGICDSWENCPRMLGRSAHERGYADNKGYVHWSRWHTDPGNKRGLHRLLTLIAVIKLRQRRIRPDPWQAIYEAEVWAQQEGMTAFKVRFPWSYSRYARQEAGEDFRRRRVPVAANFTAYQWIFRKNPKENR